MSRVITFSRTFPAYHPKAGKSTKFPEMILQWYWNQSRNPYHTIDSLLEDANEGWGEHINRFYDSLDREVSQWKNHTIRAGKRWKVGDKFSPRVWGDDINPKSGKSGPYHSKQITIAPDIEIKRVYDFRISCGQYILNGNIVSPDFLCEIAENDGLHYHDFQAWFKYPKPFFGQIICWNESINY